MRYFAVAADLRRCALLAGLSALPVAVSLGGRSGQAQTAADPLASWNSGAAKRAILDFVHATTNRAGPNYVPPDDRIATFDQDGTLWVEHPLYTQAMFAAELWVGTADRLPRMIRAVYVNAPNKARLQVEFSDWRLNAPVRPDSFTSARAMKAPRMPFARPDAEAATK